MFGPKIKVEKSLYDRVVEATERVGYSSVDEFVAHVLEKEVNSVLNATADAATDEEVKKQLRGLGYIE